MDIDLTVLKVPFLQIACPGKLPAFLSFTGELGI
jgi:hypothetical protein